MENQTKTEHSPNQPSPSSPLLHPADLPEAPEKTESPGIHESV